MNLNPFNTQNLFDATTDLFAQLGITLKSNTKNKLDLKGLLKDHYKSNDTFKTVTAAYFTGIIDESVFGLLNNGYNVEEALQQGNKNYEGLMLFALHLSKQPTRTQISELTRAFNRVSQKMPVGLILKYEIDDESAISIALSERFKYKQNWRQGEKAGKVIILRDIRIVNTHAGHKRILLDLQKHQATTYDQLHAYWLKVLDVSVLNKQFYQDLFEWYLWAVKNVKFPQIRPDKDDLLDNHVHQSESVIRLLTRLLFCWFMREKNELIKKELFDKAALQNILNNFEGENGKDSTYYRAILQNLFFATLSVPIKDRKYIKDTDAFPNKDYGNPYVFRFQEYFVNPKENLKLFKDIPFLNGGLFECLDFVPKPEESNRKETRLDGFSTKKSKQAHVPDFLFWGQHSGIDLSTELDNPRKKNVSIQGIIDLLNSYKFTIEENTPIEEEIALDPELLGKVFENLLASYNPETKTTARKQTGSFYTPREIVDYMVDESLMAYLQTATALTEETLRQLIGYSETEIKLTTAERKKIVEAIDVVKILDPACGSGAFPMGVLHKLVWILKKADPDNKLWLEAVISRLPHTLQEATRKKFENENLDYIRKLGLIQQSIYGIDIQPIATQISKLRFFISLIVDQKIQLQEENYGLLPLPNLDFKLVAANTLIAPTESEQVNTGLFADTESDFERRFKDYTAQYFNVAAPKEKLKLRGKIEELIENKVAEKVAQVKKLSSHKDERYSKQVAAQNKALIEERKAEAKLWQSYTHLFKHESVGFFETKYFFPEVKEGFDVVIGNPPYVQLQKNGGTLANEFSKSNYKTYERMGDIYSLFYERGWQILKPNGLLCYITSNKWMRAGYGESTRKFFAENTNPTLLIDFAGQKIFDAATVDTNILLFKKQINSGKTLACVIKDDELNSLSAFVRQKGSSCSFNNTDSWVILSDIEQRIKEKIERIGTPLKDWDIQINYGIKTGFNEAFIIDGAKRKELIKQDPKSEEIIRPILRGRDIKRYGYDFADLWLLFIPWHFPLHFDSTITGPSDKAEESFRTQYPAVYDHLLSYKKELENRNKAETGIRYEWYALQRWGANYWDDFNRQKIIFQEMVQEPSFILDEKGEFMCLDTARIITGKDLEIVLSVLNSKVFFYSVKTFYGGGSLGETGVRMKHTFFENFPMPQLSHEEKRKIKSLIKNPTDNNLKSIDAIIYKSYLLERHEIEVIESQ